MKFHYFFFLTLFIFCFHLSFSQSDFESEFETGIVITMDNDTLQGELKFDEHHPLPLTFKPNGGGEIQLFNEGEILSFQTGNRPTRVYRYVEVDYASRIKTQLNRVPGPKFVKKYVYLEIVESGKLNLYYLHSGDGLNHHFFVEGKEQPFEELIYTRHFADEVIMGARKTVTVENKKYQVQLSFLLSDCPEAFDLIDETRYHLTEMRKLFQIYNQFHGAYSSYKPGVKKRNKVKFGFVGGVKWAQIYTHYAIPISPLEVELESGTNPYIGGSFRIRRLLGNPNINLYNEVGFSAISGESSYRYVQDANEYEDHDLYLTVVQVGLVSMVQYRSLNKGIAPFFSAGIGIWRSLAGRNVVYREVFFQNNPIPLEQSNFNVFGVAKQEMVGLMGAGLSWGKVRIEGRYGYGSGIGRKSTTSNVYLLAGFEF